VIRSRRHEPRSLLADVSQTPPRLLFQTHPRFLKRPLHVRGSSRHELCVARLIHGSLQELYAPLPIASSQLGFPEGFQSAWDPTRIS
jgi:hypothetical protein